MKKYDYLLVGAGLFNAVLACELQKQGKSCLVLEKRDHIGGNIYTEEVDPLCECSKDGAQADAECECSKDGAQADAECECSKDGEQADAVCECAKGGAQADASNEISVHKYGAHIFHTSDKKVWDYVNQFVTMNHYINSPVAIYKEELYNLPFNMNTFSRMWGVKTPQEAKERIAAQIEKLGIKNPKNLEEQALSLVGTDVYEKLVKGYTEKQWGRDCSELPAFIIKRLPLRFTYDNNYFNDPYQGIPKEGYTAMVQKMFGDAKMLCGVDFLEQREQYEELAEHIIYTGQIDAFFDYALGVLEYRKVEFETTCLECDNYQGNAVVNYTEREVPYTRIIEHKHFVFGQQKGTVISKEYPAEWQKGDEPYYPINDEKNSALFERYQALAEQMNEKRRAEGKPVVFFGGRLGEYKYYDMDKVIAQALKLAETL